MFPDHFVYTHVGSRRAVERALFDLRPGVTEVYFHPAVDTDELRGVAPRLAGPGRGPRVARARTRRSRDLIDRAGRDARSATASSATCSAPSSRRLACPRRPSTGSGSRTTCTAEGDPLVLVCGLGQPAISWQFSLLPGSSPRATRWSRSTSAAWRRRMHRPRRTPSREMAADTAALIEHLALGPCIVAGYSLGSWICEVLAAERPDLVRAAVFIAGLNQTTEWEKVECEYGRDLAALDVPLPRQQGLFEVLVYPPRAGAAGRRRRCASSSRCSASDPPWANPGRLGQWEAAYAVDPGGRGGRRRPSQPHLGRRASRSRSTDDIDSPPGPRADRRRPGPRLRGTSRSPTPPTSPPSPTPTRSPPPSPPSPTALP